jgi:predicted nucleotidyltransferase
MGDEVKWNVTVSRELDTGVREYLAEHGETEADLSRFVEKALARALLLEAMRECGERNSDLSEQDAEALVAEAVRETRKSYRIDPNSWTDGDCAP